MKQVSTCDPFDFSRMLRQIDCESFAGAVWTRSAKVRLDVVRSNEVTSAQLRPDKVRCMRSDNVRLSQGGLVRSGKLLHVLPDS